MTSLKILQEIFDLPLWNFLTIEYDEQYFEHRVQNRMWVNRALLSFDDQYGSKIFIDLKSNKIHDSLPYVEFELYTSKFRDKLANGMYKINGMMYGANVIGNEDSIDHILIQTTISIIKIKVNNIINEYGFWIETEYDLLAMDFRGISKN